MSTLPANIIWDNRRQARLRQLLDYLYQRQAEEPNPTFDQKYREAVGECLDLLLMKARALNIELGRVPPRGGRTDEAGS